MKNEGLEAFNRINNKSLHLSMHLQEGFEYQQDLSIIEKELKDKEKIETRLSLIETKIKARRKEDCDTMSDTDEDSWLHERCEQELPLLDWFMDLLKEVLL